MSKIDHSLFSAHEHALQEAFGQCPDCGEKLTLKHGKSGAFIGCSTYPKCDFTKPLHETESAEIKQIEGSHCPECNAILAIKKGRFGLFIGCSNFPQCHHIEPVKQQDDTHLNCPVCNSGHLVKRANKFGKNFYACNGFPKCKYAVNFPPVSHACDACGWPIMLEKKSASGKVLQCPQRMCNHKINI